MKELVKQYLDHGMSRRQLMTGLSALGMSTIAARSVAQSLAAAAVTEMVAVANAMTPAARPPHNQPRGESSTRELAPLARCDARRAFELALAHGSRTDTHCADEAPEFLCWRWKITACGTAGEVLISLPPEGPIYAALPETERTIEDVQRRANRDLTLVGILATSVPVRTLSIIAGSMWSSPATR